MSDLKVAGWALILWSALVSLPFVALYAVEGQGIMGAAGFTAAVVTGGVIMLAAGIGLLVAASKQNKQ